MPTITPGLLSSTLSLLLFLPAPSFAACECGYRIAQTAQVFTHHQFTDFSALPASASFSSPDWQVQTWLVPADNKTRTLARQNEAENVWVANRRLHLRQRAYKPGDAAVSVAEVHSVRDDVMHGNFRMRYSVRQRPGARGGTVAGFFFYHSDAAEADIEIITKADASTVHYTNHPGYDPVMDTAVPDATFKEQLELQSTHEQEHQFTWTRNSTRFYQDGVLKREIRKNVPPGKIMFNLWANNGSWSGLPSTKDVEMLVKYVNLYFNTSESDAGNDTAFLEACQRARGRRSAVCEVDRDLKSKHVDSESGAGKKGVWTWSWAAVVGGLAWVWR